MQVIAYCFVTRKYYNFRTLEEAARFTRISEKRILACIKNGWRWKLWTFDEG